MSKRTTGALCAAVVGCAGLTAFATTGFSDDPASDAGPAGQYRVLSPALEAAGGPAPLAAAKKKRPKPPKVTNLITTNPVPVPAGDEIVAELVCTPAQGMPLTGGAIAPPAPAEVAISVISRFSPNPPFEASPRSYYVGVRNFGATPQEFRATLVCAKGITETK